MKQINVKSICLTCSCCSKTLLMSSMLIFVLITNGFYKEKALAKFIYLIPLICMIIAFSTGILFINKMSYHSKDFPENSFDTYGSEELFLSDMSCEFLVMSYEV